MVLKNARLVQVVLLPVLVLGLAACPPMLSPHTKATGDIAREWNELMLEAQRHNTPAPTVFARTLWHVSATMYEAWAAYDDKATGYFTGYRLKQPGERQTLANRAETLSHAVYILLRQRFAHFADMPEDSEAFRAYQAFEDKMRDHGYLDADGVPVPSEAQALGAHIADVVQRYAAHDGANEAGGYASPVTYTPSNDPLPVTGIGAAGLEYPNEWQPLQMANGVLQGYLTPHWGAVAAFAISDSPEGGPRIDPGPPPMLGTASEEAFIQDCVQVVRYSSALDPTHGPGSALVDVSPGVFQNNSLGTNDGTGHGINPVTGEAYPSNPVRYGDWLRVIAEFWADGPRSETPPGHWNTLANGVLAGKGVVSARAANKPRAADLEYDVKLYFALNGALHDAAITAWSLKKHYNLVRPISAIRYLAAQQMLPLEPGLVEVIQPGDPLAGSEGEYEGHIKIRAWAGPDQGVRWILGETWHPYQDEDFVTPPFPGYTSGHSTFSRAAAEVLTRFTGDPYFPGGLAEYPVADLRFESEPIEPLALQWATYYDAADEAGESRLAGGIHISADDLMGRITGAAVGEACYQRATDYFEGRGVAVAK